MHHRDCYFVFFALSPSLNFFFVTFIFSFSVGFSFFLLNFHFACFQLFTIHSIYSYIYVFSINCTVSISIYFLLLFPLIRCLFWKLGILSFSAEFSIIRLFICLVGGERKRTEIKTDSLPRRKS